MRCQGDVLLTGDRESAADPFYVFNVADHTAAMANWAAWRFDAHQEILAVMASRLFGSHLRVIAMTTHAMSGGRDKCLLAGMDGSISKPLMPVDVHRQLAEVFSLR